MDDRSKNKDQLINELEQMRQRVAVLERAETENGRIQEDLKKQNDELQFILDSVPAFIFYKDREGRLIRGNAAVARSAEMPKEGWVGKTVFDLLPGLAESYFEDDMEVMTSGKPKRNIVEPFDTPKGLRWLRTTKIPAKDPEGNVTGLIGFSVDVTDRVQAEEALRESEEKLRTIFDSSSDGIVMVDLEGKVIEANEAALRMAGYSREEVIGRNAFEFIAERDRTGALEVMVNAIKGGPSIGGAEYTVVTADGKEFLAEFSTAMLRDNLDNVIGFIATIRDVTERRRAETELQSYRDRLERMVEERTADLTVANRQLKQEIANRKRAEVAMKDSEERLRTTFESMAEGVLIVDLQGNIAEANRTALNMAKCRKKELIGRSIFEFIAPEERTQSMAELGAVLAAGINRADLEYTFVDAEGKRIDAEFSATLLRDSGGNPAGIIGIARDLTERKRMEAALRASEARYRELYEHMTSGVIVYEAINGGEDFIGKDFNSAAEKISKLRREDFIGRSVLETKSGLKKSGLFDAMQEVWRTGKPQYMSESYYEDVSLSGWRENFIYKLPSGEVVTVYNDITERKRMQDALRESEEKLRIVFNAISDGIAVTDLQINVVQANEAVTRMAGYSTKDEVIGKNALEWIAPKDLHKAMEPMNEALKGRPVERVELRIRNTRGTEFLGDVGVSPLRDSSGNMSGFVTVIRDVTERRRAEEALRQSEEKYRSLVDHMQEGYIIVRGEHIKYANERCAEFLGVPVDKIIGKSIWEFIVPADAEKAKQTGEVFSRGGVTPLQEFNYYREDGRLVPLEVNLKAVSYEGKPALAVVLRDITERKQMEKDLRESEEKLRTMFETMRDGVVLTDTDGKIVDVNEAIVQIGRHGSREKLIGQIGFDLVVDKDRDRLVGAVAESLSGGGTAGTWEARFSRGDGTEFDAEMTGAMMRDSTGEPSGFIGVIRDITDRKRMEEAVRDSEAKLRFMFSSMIDAVVVVDLEGKITEINDAAFRMTGYSSREEVIGKNAFDFIAEEDRARAVGDLAKSLETAPGFMVQYKFVDKEGKQYDVEAAGSMLFDNDGNVTGFINVVRDITERKRMQEELRQSEEKLRAMFNSIGDAVTITDLKGTILDENEAAVRIAGLTSKDDLIGKNGFELIAEKDRAKAIKDMLSTFKHRDNLTMEYALLRNDGSQWEGEASLALMRDSSGKPMGVVAVTKDITERKRMQEELKQSEEKLRAIFESIGDAIIVIGIDGAIQDVNAEACRMLGCRDKVEVVGRRAWEFLTAGDRSRSKEYSSRLFGEGQAGTIEFTLKDPDGRDMYVESRSSLIRDTAGKPVGLVGISRDVTERRRMEDALRESEEKLRTMFEAIEDGITLTDLKGNIVQHNEAARRMLGYGRKDKFSGKKGMGFIAKKDRARAEQYMTDVFEKGRGGTIEYSLVAKDGTEVDAEVHATLIRDSSGNPTSVVGVARDITERKRMQEALRESEEKLRFMFDSIADGMILVDLSGSIQEINAAAARMAGFNEKEEMIGRNAFDFIAERDRDRALAENMKNIAEGRGSSVVYTAVDRHGKEITAEAIGAMLRDAAGNPIGFITVIRDITERMRMQEALRESEEKLRFMFNSIADGVVSVDLEGNIWDANPAFVHMTGYGSKEEILGRGAFDLVAPRDSARARDQFAKYGRGLEQTGDLEYMVKGKSGREFDADVSAGQLRDREGKPVGFIVAVRDVSERKRMQEELRESEEKLRTILDTSPDFIMSLDRGGKLLFINRTVPEMTVEQAVGTSAYDYILQEAREDYKQTVERIFATGETAAIETSGLGPGGRTSYYETRFAPVRRNGEVTSVTLISTDITERKEAGEALRKSEEKLRFMFESMGDAIVVIDPEGKITEVNERLIAMSGYGSREEVLGRSAFEFVTERDRAKAMEDFARNLERQVSATIEYVSVDRYGREFDVEANGTMLQDVAGKPVGFIIALRDVSERKLMEQKLRDSEEMARGMLESAATGIYLVQNGRFEYVSPMFATISGYTNDELIGTQALGYVHPDDREMVREKAVEGLKGKSGLPYEFRFVQKDGTIVWILEKVASIQYKGKRATIASFMDITEHRRADQALRESEEKLRGFMDSATDYFTIWDSKLNLVDLNEAALHYPLVDFTGKIQKESVIGKNILRLEPTIRETDRYDQYMEVIRTGKPFFAEDIIPHTKLGDIHMAISAFKVGEGLGIITTDVTERRRSEEELRESKVALEKRTNQLLALQKVTASIQSTLSLSDVLQQVAEGVVDNLGYDQSMVLVVDEKADIYRGQAFFSKDRPKYREGVESIMEQALADIKFPRKRGYSMGLDESMDGKVVITPNFSALSVPPLDKQQANAIQKFLGANTIVSMPLFAMERHVGGILAFTAREDIAEPDIEPLRLLADQAGVAIVNANIYEGAAEMAQRLAVTGTLSRILGSSLDIREVYKAFVEEIHNVIDFERASIALVEGDRLRFLAVSPDVEPGGGTMMPVAGSPTEWVIQQKRTNIEHDLAVEGQFPIDSVYAEEGMRAAIRVPLISKGEAFGSFDLVSRNPNAYGEREQGILEQVAGSVAAAIENSRLFIRIKEHEAELVKAYEELKKAQEYMVQAERLRALGELAGGVAHDFNNVLAIILGRAQLALEDVQDAKLKKDLQIIEQTALDAATTVRRLQDFARVRVDRGFENVDLNEVVEGALQMLESRRMELKETRGVIIDVNADLGEVPSVQGEAAELREALVNIIFNAIDAMPKGGSLTVKSRQDKEGVLLSISDTGEGIPDDVKGKIFDPFFTTRPQKGSGLGLSVTYGIITRHGGRIEFESEVGKGTTFYILLPMAIGVKAAKRPEQKAAGVKSAEVLLVDDDPEVSEVLQRMLQQMGHRVKGVNSGEEAVNTFEAGHYDLVVTDLGMPDMSGREVAAAVKDIKPGTPVLLITGWGVQLDPSELPEIDGIVAKPFSKEVLREQLAKLLPAEDGGSKEKQRKKKGPR